MARHDLCPKTHPNAKGGVVLLAFEAAESFSTWKIRPKNKSSAAPMSYGSKRASLKAGTRSFIIWLNKNYETRINPHHCAPRTICKVWIRNCPVCFGIGWVCENH